MINIDNLNKIQEFMESHITPGVGKHGGTVEIIDFDGQTLTIALGGACAICSLDTQTTAWVKSTIETHFPTVECKAIVARNSRGLDVHNPITTTIDPFDF